MKWRRKDAILLQNYYGFVLEREMTMKRLFSRSDKKARDWEAYDGQEHDWDREDSVYGDDGEGSYEDSYTGTCEEMEDADPEAYMEDGADRYSIDGMADAQEEEGMRAWEAEEDRGWIGYESEEEDIPCREDRYAYARGTRAGGAFAEDGHRPGDPYGDYGDEEEEFADAYAGEEERYGEYGEVPAGRRASRPGERQSYARGTQTRPAAERSRSGDIARRPVGAQAKGPGAGFLAKLGRALRGMDTMDKVMAGTGAAVLILSPPDIFRCGRI